MRLAALLVLGAAAGALHAQSFPVAGRPVRIVVPFPPGGQTDIQARTIAQKMNQSLNVPVIVENKPGGSSLIGARDVQRAAPDGHTLLYTFAVHVQVPFLYRTAPWDPFKDFTPITTGARSATVLTAHVSAPYNTVKELVAYAKANPGKLNYASFGAGTTAHLNGELFKKLAGIDIVHVAYEGSGDAMKDHLSGAVQLFFDGPTTAMAALPDLPTMREAGYDVGMWGYLWFWGPAGMKPATLDAVYQHVARAVAQPDVKELFANGGSEAMALPPAEMARAARDLYQRWGAVIRMLDVRLD